MVWEIPFLRKLFFLDTVEGFDDIVKDPLHFFDSNSEMEYAEDFARWIERNKEDENLKSWLEERGLKEAYKYMYIPTKTI